MIWNIIGHNKITGFLEAGIKNDSLAHAYLFYGPRQIGKKTLVKQFILNLMCYVDNPNKEEIPCAECDQCRQIKKNIHADVIWLKKEEDKKDITVEQIRNLQESLSVHSFFRGYKIAVIENAEQMNLAAANALLKTLEEPTQKTILILIAQKISRIPKTILSRTQKIKFLPVNNKDIYNYLIEKNLDHAQANELTNLSAGRPGRALIFLHNPDLWPAYIQQLKNFFLLISSSRVNRLKFVEKFLSSKETLVEKNSKIVPLLNLWQLILRDFILHKLGEDGKIVNVAGLQEMDKIGQKYSLNALVNLQKNIELTKKYLNLNVNPRLVMENLLLGF